MDSRVINKDLAREAVLITGGCGFIGTNLIELLMRERPNINIFNLDDLSHPESHDNMRYLAELETKGKSCYSFIKGSINDKAMLDNLFLTFKFSGIFHLAARTHVDDSISGPKEFTHTNVVGTHTLLEALRDFKTIFPDHKTRLVMVSTDEVYGSVNEGWAKESATLNPSSPYSASKAGAELLAAAYAQTYGLDIVVTRCANNYGPHQFSEKFIPAMVKAACKGEDLPIYGDGLQIRDWIHVHDHCRALLAVYEQAFKGSIWNVGTGPSCHERNNLSVALDIIAMSPTRKSKIVHVTDRKGHDRRYAIDSRKLEQLQWKPKLDFDRSFPDVLRWYFNKFSKNEDVTIDDAGRRNS